jgi:hypothetical protein
MPRYKLLDGIKVQFTAEEEAQRDIEEAQALEEKAEYDAEEWKRNRQAEYPTHEECIHALLDGGDTLTELQAKRTATKNKYPKPGA